MKVARPRQCCGASWPHVSGSESILSPGSKIFSPALPITLLHGSPNFCRTTGRTSKPDRQNSDCTERLQHWLVVVIFSRIQYAARWDVGDDAADVAEDVFIKVQMTARKQNSRF